MAATDAGAWARLRLVQGESATSHWEFGEATNESRLTVGSNPSCQWVVDDPSVEPFHLVLRWDGTQLSVAGSREAVDLSLDGQSVGTSFVRVGARARLEFGGCALVAETSVSGNTRRKSFAPPASPGSPGGSSGSRPPKKTITGVAPLTDSTPPTRVPQSDPAPQRKDFGATAVGLPPPPDAPAKTPEPSPAPSSSPSASGMPRLGSDRPLSSTMYGMGAGQHLNVDRVSPERLRRSSVPPAAAPAEDDPGRPTAPGYHDQGEGSGPLPRARSRDRPEPTPTDTRLIEEGQQLRGLASAPGAPRGVGRPAPSNPSSTPSGGPAPSNPAPTPSGGQSPSNPASGVGSDRPDAAGSGPADGDPGSGDEPTGSHAQRRADLSHGQPRGGTPPQFRLSGPPPARGPSGLTIVLGLATLAGLGVWVYALLSL